MKNKDEFCRIFKLEYGKKLMCEMCKNSECSLKNKAKRLLFLNLISDLTVELNGKVENIITGLNIFDLSEKSPIFKLEMVYCPKRK